MNKAVLSPDDVEIKGLEPMFDCMPDSDADLISGPKEMISNSSPAGPTLAFIRR